MLRVIAKDDCFMTFLARALSRRGVAVTIVAQQSKTTSAVLVDSIRGLQAPFDVVAPLFRRHDCLKQQSGCSTLLAEPGTADLIVIGSFSDLTLRDYRSKEEGWRFFEMSDAIADPIRLSQYERCEHLTPAQAVANTAFLFGWFLAQHPGALPIWIEYPYVEKAKHLVSRVHVENRILISRHDAFRAAAAEVLPGFGVETYRVPDELVCSRGDGRLWHYDDRVYENAAEWLTGRLTSLGR